MTDTDREKVIKALECRKNADKRCVNPCEESGMCHYATAIRDINGEIYRPFICDRERICTDALALINEQDKIIQNILLEKTNELNSKITALQIERQNREVGGCWSRNET